MNVGSRTDTNKDTWRIIHIPDKPPVPPNQQPIVSVLASEIEPNLANGLIRRLNQIAPLENLRHVKRVRKKNLDGGKIQLSAILCMALENDHELNILPEDLQDLINLYKLSPFITKVCKYAAASKEEWEEQCKLWPTSYHPPTYNIEGITGFTEEDSQSVFGFMKVAFQLAKYGDGPMTNAAVIVDPSVKQIIASARDQICSWHGPVTNKSNNESSCIEQLSSPISHTDLEGLSKCASMAANGSLESHEMLNSVSCLNPWQWNVQPMHKASSYWHPLRHAAIVAIEFSAVRDRHLFPTSGHNLQKSLEIKPVQSSPTCSPAKRQKTNPHVGNGMGSDLDSEDSHSHSSRPYLCTGYDIYFVWEPCIMCAMALVHQRIRRIFYMFPNPKAGALGSVYRLQGEKSLNHHYAVFKILPPKEVSDIKL